MKKLKILPVLPRFFSNIPPKFLPYFISTFVLTLPLLVSVFSAQIANLINSLLTGHFSYIDLAAVSYGFLVVISIVSISQGAISALMPSMQQAIKTSDTNLQMITMMTLFSYLVFSVVIFFVVYQSVYYLDVSDLYKQTIHLYLLPMFVFLLAGQILSYCVNVLIIIEKIKVIALFGLCATSIDVITSSLMVHGLFGLPRLGAQGAALGSMMGSLTVLFLVVVYLKKHLIIFKNSTNKMTGLDKKLMFLKMFNLIKRSIPAGFASFLNWVVLFFITFILTRIDTSEHNIAANQILIILSSLLLVFSKVSGGILVKKINDFESNKPIEFLLQIILGYQLFYVLLMVFVLFFFENIVLLFGVNQEIVLILAPIKWCLLVYILLSALDVVLGSYFVSKQKNNINFSSQLISIILLIIVVSTVSMFFTLSLFLLWMLLSAEKLCLISYKVLKLYQV